MVKHLSRESIKSLLGNHLDPDKDEQQQRAKTEIEDRVKSILKLVKDDNLEEDCTTAELSKKGPLVELIQDFNNHYQSLYAQYDHLTGALRKEINGKRENESSAFSSDSDSSSSDEDIENGQLENEFYKTIDGLKQELEMARIEVAELNLKLTSTHEEKEDLNSKYLAALSKIQQAEKINMDLKTDAEALGTQRSKLLVENDELKQQLDISGTIEAELSQKLEDSKTITDGMRTMVDQLQDEKLALGEELKAVTGELSILKQQLENAEQQDTNISQNLKVTEEENESLKSKLSQVTYEVQLAHNRIQELEAESIQLKEFIEDRYREVSTLIQKHAVSQNESSSSEASDQVKSIADEVKRLQLELESLQHQKTDWEFELVEKFQENLECTILMQALKEEVDRKGYDINTLLETVHMLEAQLRLSSQKLRVTEQLLIEKEESFTKGEEKFHQEQRAFVNRVATLSAIISANNEAFKEIISEIVRAVMSGIETVSLKFSDDCKNFEDSFAKISHELQAAKACVSEMNKEKEELENERQNLLENLKNKNKEELALRVLVERLEAKARREELKKTNLNANVVELKKTIEELEKGMEEKNDSMLNLGEEKREAIRQLCLWIDYHRDRYDHLKDVISGTRSGRRAA